MQPILRSETHTEAQKKRKLRLLPESHRACTLDSLDQVFIAQVKHLHGRLTRAERKVFYAV